MGCPYRCNLLLRVDTVAILTVSIFYAKIRFFQEICQATKNEYSEELQCI